MLAVSLVTTYDSITKCVTIDLFLAGVKNNSTIVKLCLILKPTSVF